MFEQYKSHDLACYAGYIKDDTELLECTSGGIATALARQMIQDGGYVAGVAYSDDFYQAEYLITRNESDLNKFKGSKYFHFDKKTIYKDIKVLLDSNERVLFFGLPCIVAALRSFLGRDYDNLIACELICHGPTSQKVHSEYIKYLEHKYNDKIADFSVRHKRDAWMPTYTLNSKMVKYLKKNSTAPNMDMPLASWHSRDVIIALSKAITERAIL